MQAHILITNGGEHPPALWAEKCSEILVDRMIKFDRAKTADERRACKELELKIQDALIPQFKKVQDAEATALSKKGDSRLEDPYDPREFLKEATAAVVEVTKGTIFAEHFSKEATQEFISAQIGQLFTSAMHVKRSWHHDRLCKKDPNNKHAKAFASRFRTPESTEPTQGV